MPFPPPQAPVRFPLPVEYHALIREYHIVPTRRDAHDDVPKAWSLRGTVAPSTSSSPSAASEKVASLTLSTSRVSVHRLNATSKRKKKRRENEGAAAAANERSSAKSGGGGGGEADVWKHLLVGAVVGGVSRSVVAPLERVKILYMVDSGKLAADGGMLGTLQRIVRTEGAAGLFRGNPLNFFRIAPTKAVELFCFDKYKEWRLETKRKTSGGGGGGGGGQNTTGGKQSGAVAAELLLELDGRERMIGGSLAFMAGTALTHPIDTLRSRVTSSGMRVGEAWTGLVQREGVGALWKGLGANMVGSVELSCPIA
jgi:hypothetical protein